MKNLFHKTEKSVNHNTKLECKVKRGLVVSFLSVPYIQEEKNIIKKMLS